ncbi:glycosyltransferase [Robertmurraya yapensis]|uniref:Glycosyltransferase n=1 Tax=Bacillus yapensis TaxID=2492960 RepID=A0A3S0KR57_9BACI|nr:glycosyltransferase [Bacillus yapensis]RTR36410.1 glycosyltransferase [Bacillus yapensis]TKT05914.1 glycosyltransferase family 4 protein [Bacillus yapensis]
MKKKILYMMHVDWGWIKQRPHFIAEKLDEVFEVWVFYLMTRNRKVMTDNPTTIRKSPIVTFPLKRIQFFNELSIFLQKILFSMIIKVYNPEYIWITYPALYNYLPKSKNKQYKIIYDCMDDVLGFNNISRIKKELELSEKQLLRDADIVFVSSENLQKTIIQRGCAEEKTLLVRNGYNGEIIIPELDDKRTQINQPFKIGYVGTISDWVDFDTILKSLESFNNIEYHFFGPIDCEVPKHSKIHFHGSVKHSDLYERVKNCDCLIMPFMINNLILSVDPVKLYEYVNFNKNIITVYYKEIERFGDFVHFYQTDDEYVAIISHLLNNNEIKYSNEQRMEFLTNNTWEKRANTISNRILKK